MFHGTLAPGIVDQDPPHRLGRGRKEVPASVPLAGLGNFDKPQIGFVHQSRRVECLSGPLLRGVRYETTAIPEIKEQAAALARIIVAGCRADSRAGSAA